MFFLPPRTVSLYGTPMWDEMTRAQRIELSRQEFVNTLSAGIWFENILNQALLRDMMHKDPTARETHYKLTELGDETRHMVMFGKAIERVGAKPVRPRLYQRMIINALPLAFKGSLLWVAALIGEEIFDSLQRQMMDDPELQPMVQRLMRIHVTEEARHIQFARDAPQASGRHAADQQVVGGQPQRGRRPVLPVPVHQPGAVPPLRTRRPQGAAHRTTQPAPPRSPGGGFRTAGRVPRGGRLDGPDRTPAVEAHRLPVSSTEHVYDVVVVGVQCTAASCARPASPTSPPGKPPKRSVPCSTSHPHLDTGTAAAKATAPGSSSPRAQLQYGVTLGALPGRRHARCPEPFPAHGTRCRRAGGLRPGVPRG